MQEWQLSTLCGAQIGRVKSAYGDKYEKLRQIKSTYDRENIFHLNANIKPTAR